MLLAFTTNMFLHILEFYNHIFTEEGNFRSAFIEINDWL